jgi:hypothetical protein
MELMLAHTMIRYPPYYEDPDLKKEAEEVAVKYPGHALIEVLLPSKSEGSQARDLGV